MGKILEEIKLGSTCHEAHGAKHIPDDHRADVVAVEAHSNGGEHGNVQQQGTDFIIALQEALAGNNSGCARVSELIEGKADVNQTYDDPQGGPQSVLTMAVLCNNAILTKMLCEAKADVASQVGEYSSPVRLAYETGRQDSWQVLAFFPECYMAPDITLEIVKMLVAAQTDINWADVKGQTALHHHAAAGRFEAASCLVQLNARIDQKDVEGKAPIHVVAEVTQEWLLLLGFVQLVNIAGDEMALPISELTLEDFAHSIRHYLQEYYQEHGRKVSYFTIGIVVGSLGHTWSQILFFCFVSVFPASPTIPIKSNHQGHYFSAKHAAKETGRWTLVLGRLSAARSSWQSPLATSLSRAQRLKRRRGSF